jgi:hypothetical protein
VAKSKSVIVTFRVDPHLAEALEGIPDKSAFIRDALRNSLHQTCPACGGEGRVDCDAARWLSELLERHQAQTCSCCGTAFPPELAAAGAAAGAARATGGPAPVCGHCGPGGHRH